MLRFLCIVQLCIGFSLLFWVLCYPTLGTIYEDKRKILILESALGCTSGLAFKLATDLEKKTLKRHAELAESIPIRDRDFLVKLKDSLTKKAQHRSFSNYFTYIGAYLFQNPYFFLYTAFSILIPLLILLSHSSSLSAIIFLPLLAAGFIFDNLIFAPIKKESAEERLFPAKLEGLDHYLIDTYLNQTPSLNPHAYLKQKEEALYLLLVERAKLQKVEGGGFFPQERKSKAMLLLFFLWNMLVAYLLHKQLKKCIQPLI